MNKNEEIKEKEKSNNVGDKVPLIPDLEERRFTANELYAWIQTEAGVSQSKIAKTLNVGTRQIQRYVRKIRDVLIAKFDLEKYRELCFYGNVYQAIDNVGYLLTARDPQMTIHFLKGMGIFKEYVYAEGKREGDSEEEIRNRIRRQAEALGFRLELNGTGKNRISETLFSTESSQKHEGGES